jgi:hypothetical protein
MNEIEDKYKRFSLDENMIELFSHCSVGVEDMTQTKADLIITTVVIDPAAKSHKSQENKDAKLV